MRVRGEVQAALFCFFFLLPLWWWGAWAERDMLNGLAVVDLCAAKLGELGYQCPHKVVIFGHIGYRRVLGFGLVGLGPGEVDSGAGDTIPDLHGVIWLDASLGEERPGADGRKEGLRGGSE